MKKLILLSALLSGCAAYPDYTTTQNGYAQDSYLASIYSKVVISPSVAPDGSKSFTAVGYNQSAKYSAPGETLEQTHKRMIATELAKQKLCMNGYSFIDKKVVGQQVVYRGKCK